MAAQKRAINATRKYFATTQACQTAFAGWRGDPARE